MPLVLSREVGQELVLKNGNDIITLKIVEDRGRVKRFAIDAPKHYDIIKGEKFVREPTVPPQSEPAKWKPIDHGSLHKRSS
jgi:sRNA-binding carbon storage regulator CsrA